MISSKTRLGFNTTYSQNKFPDNFTRDSVRNSVRGNLNYTFSKQLDSRFNASYEQEIFDTSGSNQSNYTAYALGSDLSYIYKKYMSFNVNMNYRSRKNSDNSANDEDNFSFAISMNYKL